MTEILFSEKHLAESVRHGCKQGGTVGKRSPLRDTGVSAFLLLCSNGKLKIES